MDDVVVTLRVPCVLSLLRPPPPAAVVFPCHSLHLAIIPLGSEITHDAINARR